MHCGWTILPCFWLVMFSNEQMERSFRVGRLIFNQYHTRGRAPREYYHSHLLASANTIVNQLHCTDFYCWWENIFHVFSRRLLSSDFFFFWRLRLVQLCRRCSCQSCLPATEHHCKHSKLVLQVKVTYGDQTSEWTLQATQVWSQIKVKRSHDWREIHLKTWNRKLRFDDKP